MSTQVMIIAVIVLVMFGSKRIPEFLKNFKLAVKEFKKALNKDA